MIYLFEDKLEDSLSKLFRYSLPDSVKDSIEYSDGNGNSKTFEKFCKLYLRKNGGHCIYPEDTFFIDDCRCSTVCEKMQLRDKSENYRGAYKLFWNLENDMEKIWSVHKELLKITNDAIERYNTAGYQNIKVYPAIVS